jgi:hypothetical protein
MTVKERLIEFLKYKKIGQKKFAQEVGLSDGYVNAIRVSIQPNTLHKIAMQYPELNTGWLLTGEGKMLKKNHENKVPEHKIPFYDDVIFPVGSNNYSNIMQPTEFVNPGDWFKEATAAIRHHDDSMPEYPDGCILALKEVYNKDLLIPGKDYAVETNEFCVTKKILLDNDKSFLRAYSTNLTTYSDGRLVYEPFDIPLNLINRISLVLGYIVIKNGRQSVHFSDPLF